MQAGCPGFKRLRSKISELKPCALSFVLVDELEFTLRHHCGQEEFELCLHDRRPTAMSVSAYAYRLCVLIYTDRTTSAVLVGETLSRLIAYRWFAPTATAIISPPLLDAVDIIIMGRAGSHCPQQVFVSYCEGKFGINNKLLVPIINVLNKHT